MEKKHDKQELLVYALLWGIMFLAPVLSMYIRSTQDDNLTFQWDNVWFIWRQYALFFAIFLIHNFLLAPLLVYKQHRLHYFSSWISIDNFLLRMSCGIESKYFLISSLRTYFTPLVSLLIHFSITRFALCAPRPGIEP